MFENFPYTDMHQLNMDWIIKIAKDFLDQYTSIQQLISDGETSLQNLTESGLTQLQEKADALESALDAWYNEHSEDIANQLASALSDLNAWYNEHSADISGQLQSALTDLNAWYTEHQDYLNHYLTTSITAFNTAAETKAAQTIASIPADYTNLSYQVSEQVEGFPPHAYDTWASGGSFLDGVFTGTYSGQGDKPAAVCLLKFWRRNYQDAGLVTNISLQFHVDSDIANPEFYVYPWVDGNFVSVSSRFPVNYDPVTKIYTILLTDVLIELSNNYTGNNYTILIQPTFDTYSTIQLSAFKFKHTPIINETNSVSIDAITFDNPSVSDGTVNLQPGWTYINKVITCNYTSEGNTWFDFPITVSDLINNMVLISCDVHLESGSQFMPYLFGSKTDGTPIYSSRVPVLQSGHYEDIIDLNYFVVYADLDTNRPVSWGMANLTNPCQGTISNIKIATKKYLLDSSKEFYENINEMIADIQENSNNITVLSAEKYLTSPNGNKFSLAVSNDGSIHAIPTIPNKTLFIGNSLLIGNEYFGMCASAPNKDYYHYVTQAILAKNPNATFSKLPGVDFEACVTVEDAQSWMNNNLLPVLDNSTNLVIVQLGDNVNNQARETAFATTCPMLIQFIKEHAPNARIAWAGEWYGNNNKQTIITNACADKGALFIDFSSLATSDNTSYLGAVINYGITRTRTYTIDLYSDDAANHELHITFTTSGNQYSCVVPYNSYSASGNTIDITGDYGFVWLEGVASHPGDSGFYAIGQLMIELLGLS